MIKRILATLLTLVAPVAAIAAPSILTIPITSNTPGANGTNWKTEITLHNSGRQMLPVTLTFRGSDGAFAIDENRELSIAPRGRLSLDDVVGSLFGRTGIGAIEIATDERFASKLAVHARVYNLTPDGSLGQDVPALPVTATLTSGDTGVLAGPSDRLAARFSFGVYTVDPATLEWRLLRSDGSLAASVERSYSAREHVQYVRGIETLLGAVPADGDIVHAVVRSGKLFLFGSAVDEKNGDPTYVQGIRTRENLAIELVGIDTNDDGTVDLFDANRDGVLDATLTIVAGRFGNFFRIVASDPEGAVITFALSEANRDVALLDGNGKIAWNPSVSLIGTSGSLKVKASDGIDQVELTLPVVFR